MLASALLSDPLSDMLARFEQDRNLLNARWPGAGDALMGGYIAQTQKAIDRRNRDVAAAAPLPQVPEEMPPVLLGPGGAFVHAIHP